MTNCRRQADSGRLSNEPSPISLGNSWRVHLDARSGRWPDEDESLNVSIDSSDLPPPARRRQYLRSIRLTPPASPWNQREEWKDWGEGRERGMLKGWRDERLRDAWRQTREISKLWLDVRPLIKRARSTLSSWITACPFLSLSLSLKLSRSSTILLTPHSPHEKTFLSFSGIYFSLSLALFPTLAIWQ